jgi:hypothetical protein
MEEFRVIIAGGRQFSDYGLLSAKCDGILSQKRMTHRIVIISGTARGADTLGEQYARERGYTVERFPADWNTLGKRAGYVRNCQMADNADALIAFWDGESPGTKNMIEIARERNLAVRVIIYT